MDLSAAGIVVLYKANNIELSASFISFEQTSDSISLEFEIPKDKFPFKIIGLTPANVIIKNGLESIVVSMDVSKIKFVEKNNLHIIVKAEKYEIEYI